MADTILIPGVGTYTVVGSGTSTRLMPGAGTFTEVTAAAAGTNRLLLINPPGLDGGFANGGLTL